MNCSDCGNSNKPDSISCFACETRLESAGSIGSDQPNKEQTIPPSNSQAPLAANYQVPQDNLQSKNPSHNAPTYRPTFQKKVVPVNKAIPMRVGLKIGKIQSFSWLSMILGSIVAFVIFAFLDFVSRVGRATSPSNDSVIYALLIMLFFFLLCIWATIRIGSLSNNARLVLLLLNLFYAMTIFFFNIFAIPAIYIVYLLLDDEVSRAFGKSSSPVPSQRKTQMY